MSYVSLLAKKLNTSSEMIEEILDQLVTRGYLTTFAHESNGQKGCSFCKGCVPLKGRDALFWQITNKGKKIVGNGNFV